MKGIWEMPLETFIGEAAVVNLTDLTPQPINRRMDYPGIDGWNVDLNDMSGSFAELWPREPALRGQEIRPEHLDNIAKGDIVLMTSPFTGLEQPWLSKTTCEWLVDDRQIKNAWTERHRHSLAVSPKTCRRTIHRSGVPCLVAMCLSPIP